MNGPGIIRKYILAKKGVDIGGIAQPTTPHQWDLYHQALLIAMMWRQQQEKK